MKEKAFRSSLPMQLGILGIHLQCLPLHILNATSRTSSLLQSTMWILVDLVAARQITTVHHWTLCGMLKYMNTYFLLGLKEARKAALKFAFILCKMGEAYVLCLNVHLVSGFLLCSTWKTFRNQCLTNLKQENNRKNKQNLTQICKSFLTSQASAFLSIKGN